jgi:hypothetical protein
VTHSAAELTPVRPTPSSPLMLAPHAITSPSSLTANACLSPADAATILGRPWSFVGFGTYAAVSFVPTCPNLLSPQPARCNQLQKSNQRHFLTEGTQSRPTCVNILQTALLCWSQLHSVGQPCVSTRRHENGTKKAYFDRA